MAVHHDKVEPDRVVVATSHGLGPMFDGLMRGALAIGFLGLGVGGLATWMLRVPFDTSMQWGFAGGGALLGMILGATRGLHHRG